MCTLRAALCVVAVVGWAATAAAAPRGSAHLPKQHKQAPELVLPDTASIPGQRLGEWDVDRFFSLWYIFALSDNVEVSTQPYTVLAPSNAAFDRVKLEPGFSGRDHIVNVLRNHIVLGQLVTGERLKQVPAGGQLRLDTLLGTPAVFERLQTGGFVVNGTAIIGDIIEIKNASIVRIADYLPLPDPLPVAVEAELIEPPLDGSGDGAATEPDSSDGDLALSAAGIETLPLLNEVGEIADNEVGEVAEAESGAVEQSPFTTDNQRLKIPAVGKDSFIEAVEDALSLLKSGVGEFQGYFYDVNITAMFSKEKEYTLFLPVNEAFQRYYPIDWGFNPFLVKDFTRETILNHFAPGKITSRDIADGAKIKTMGGKELQFQRVGDDLLVNGHHLFLGDTPISHGNILFLDELLFVDFETVAELRAQHRDKETAPLLSGTAGEAAYLAHLIGLLSHLNESESSPNVTSSSRFTKFVEYVTRGFEDISRNVTNDHKYTIFVLEDAAIHEILGTDPEREFNPDPFIKDGQLRTGMLLSHLVAERLYLHDLRGGSTIETIGGQKLRVNVKNDVIYINDAQLLPRMEHVYNLGNVLFVDAFPSLSAEELRELSASAPPPLEGSGSGLELELPAHLDLGLEGVESFAGELGAPEGMIRHDGIGLAEDDVFVTDLSERP